MGRVTCERPRTLSAPTAIYSRTRTASTPSDSAVSAAMHEMKVNEKIMNGDRERVELNGCIEYFIAENPTWK